MVTLVNTSFCVKRLGKSGHNYMDMLARCFQTNIHNFNNYMYKESLGIVKCSHKLHICSVSISSLLKYGIHIHKNCPDNDVKLMDLI